MKIEFEHHIGVQYDDGSVAFYGIFFPSILEAVAYMRSVPFGYNYIGMMTGSVNILKDLANNLYFNGDRWCGSKKEALKRT
jgi:hypothetical protein